MAKRKPGRLIIVGGHEAKGADRPRDILEEIARRGERERGHLLIVTVATQYPAEVAKEYTRLFRDLGVGEVAALDIRAREDARTEEAVEKVRGASVVFFTGGDQLRITSQVGDSPVYRCLRERFEQGLTIAGTSAGAAAMPATMIVGGAGDTSHEISALAMAPGIGLIDGVVVDSHFAERGRFGRLLGAVAQNPKNLGLGIDEDTAVVVEGSERFRVIGTGAVYVVDGATVTYSSLSEQHPEGILSIFGVTVHVLGAGDRFDLRERKPAVDPRAAEGSEGQAAE